MSDTTMTTRQTSGAAIASMLLGIASFLCSILTAIPAIICGHVAVHNINKSMGRLSGMGMAITGLVLGYLNIVMIPILGLLIAIALPNFVIARAKSQMNTCKANMKQIDGAICQYQLDNTVTGNVSLADLCPTYIKMRPSCPAGGTYTIDAQDPDTKVTCDYANPDYPHKL